MTRSPTTIGELCPRPAMTAFQTTFSELDQRSGGVWSGEATPLPCWPRQQGQSVGANRIALVDSGRLSAARPMVDHAVQLRRIARILRAKRDIEKDVPRHEVK